MSAPRTASRLVSRAIARRRSALASSAVASRARPLLSAGSTSFLPPASVQRLQTRHASSLPPRAEKFTKPTQEHLKDLRALLSAPTSLLTTLDNSSSADDLKIYNDDWLNKYHGQSSIVVKPKTTEEVSKVLKYCYDKGLAVVPQGGNTGLVGGSNPVYDEIILSLSNLNQVRSFDPVSGILIADAGVILENADHYLADQGFIFPLDLGAKGSCHIGGNVATNAGGLRLLRYGSLHGSVLGLEVVLPDGTVWDGLSKLRKDNTGFDLKQLFIGSEGTIGIITAVSILCPRRSSAQNVAVFSLPSYESALQVFAEAKGHLGEILSAFEFFDKQGYAVTKKHLEENGVERKAFETEGEFYCLIETSGSNADHDEEKLSNLFEHLISNEIVLDGVLAQDSTQFTSLWQLRELLPEACSKAGAVFKYDLSVPVEQMYTVVEKARERLRDAGLMEGDGTPEGPIRAVVGYGHIGDGNVHLNVVADKFSDEVAKTLEPFIYEVVSEYGGSISAEHGLGLMKAPYIRYSKSDVSVEMMRKFKHMFDPKGLLNPYKYILD